MDRPKFFRTISKDKFLFSFINGHKDLIYTKIVNIKKGNIAIIINENLIVLQRLTQTILIFIHNQTFIWLAKIKTVTLNDLLSLFHLCYDSSQIDGDKEI